jgi:hypothetical protein
MAIALKFPRGSRVRITTMWASREEKKEQFSMNREM